MPTKETFNALNEVIAEVERLHSEIEKMRPKQSELRGPASSSQIDAAEQALGTAFPNTYRRFLSFHNGWILRSAWSVRGTEDSTSPTGRDIQARVRLFDEVLRHNSFLDDLSIEDQISQIRKGKSDWIYVPDHLIVGTNFNDALVVFEASTKDTEPGLIVVRHATAGRRFENFVQFLSFLVDSAREDMPEGVRSPSDGNKTAKNKRVPVKRPSVRKRTRNR